MAITSGSAPGGTISISRVDLSRSGRSSGSGSGGSTGSTEVKEGQYRDVWWERWRERVSDSECWRKDEEEGGGV
jgi:hypothetical protein